jgi:ABC-type glycerol-3-phosphate transport system permease component
MPVYGEANMGVKKIRHTKMRQSVSDRVFYIADYTLLTLAGLLVLLPLLNIVSQAFSSPQSVMAGTVLFWPRRFTLENISRMLTYRYILVGFANTLFYTVAGTVINLIMTVLCAYPLAQPDFRGRNFLSLLFAFTMMFSGGMIPTYVLMKDLGLLNTRWVMLLPGAMAVWNMILCRTFFQNTIPRDLYESAELDGASDIKVLLRIVLPLSAPILAVLTLFYAVGHWNSYFNAMMYLSKPELYNIQLILQNSIANMQSILQYTTERVDLVAQASAMAKQEAAKYALIVISTVPILVIYPFVQKHFVKGIMIGALKG